MDQFKIDINKLVWGEDPTIVKRIGLYFGTFNPVHIGHLIIANYVVETTNLDEVWFVVTPHNPHKKKANLLEDHHRLALVKEAIDDNLHLKASNIEFSLPQPNYTVNTLAHLTEKYPKKKFALIMGEDNLRTLHKWKNYEQIIENYPIIVYPRVRTIQEEGVDVKSNGLEHLKNIIKADAPLMNISASFIRNCIKEKTDVRYMLTDKVRTYIEDMHFYE